MLANKWGRSTTCTRAKKKWRTIIIFTQNMNKNVFLYFKLWPRQIMETIHTDSMSPTSMTSCARKWFSSFFSRCWKPFNNFYLGRTYIISPRSISRKSFPTINRSPNKFFAFNSKKWNRFLYSQTFCLRGFVLENVR